MSAKKLPFDQVKEAARAALPRVLDWAGVHWQQAGHEIQMINPCRSNDDGFGSFSINATNGVWGEFATGEKGGDVIALVAYLKGYGQGEACKDLARLFGIMDGDAIAAVAPAPRPVSATHQSDENIKPVFPIPPEMMGRIPRDKYKHPGAIKQFWWYTDSEGQKLFAIVRIEPGMNGRSKDYFPLSVWCDSVTGEKKWRWKGIPVPRVLYGLDRLAARPDEPVMICEGEKAADAAGKLCPEYVAITWPNGAKGMAATDWTPLSGRRCVIWPDNDNPGADAVIVLRGLLSSVGAMLDGVVSMDAFAAFNPSSDGGVPVLVDGGRWEDGDDAADAMAGGWQTGHIALLRDAGKWIDGEEVDKPTVDVPEGNQDKPVKARKKSGPKPIGTASGNPFTATEQGIFYQTPDMEAAAFVCAPLNVVARTRDANSEAWGFLVRFHDPDGEEKEWNILASLLATSDGGDVIRGLLDRGLFIGAGPTARRRLLEYLARYTGAERATIVPRLGWHGDAFLLPDGSIGGAGEPFVFQAAARQREAMQCAGTLDGWQNSIARYCAGNSRLAFAVSSAFAAPLLDVIGSESGGIHFFGDSSQGKTTLLQVASSVFGGPNYLQTWRATDNAIEAIAAAYSDCLLPLDEIHQCDPRIVGDTVYMLGNGRGKSRATDKGTSRGSVAEWRVLFLSSGEKTLADHMAEARKEMKAGMEVRMLAIQADAGKGLGLFDTLHDMPDGKVLADHFKAAVKEDYGTPSRVYLERLAVERGNGVAGGIVEAISRFCREVVPANAHGQVHRAAARFALVAVAGELASAWGVTGWGEGVSWSAAKACFAGWLRARGTSGNREDMDILAKVRLFLEQDGDARFTRLTDESVIDEHNGYGTAPDPDDHAPRTASRCGYRLKDRVSGAFKYFIFPESFRTQVCAGMDVSRVCRLLKEANALECSAGSNMLRTRVIPEAKINRSKQAYVYCVTSNLFTMDSDSDE